ncbi:unnamed protein product [Calypogeia fissa]
MRVEAHLYKLLLYEKGGQFKMHRDTEKEKGMFATMVLQLPTEVGFEGGELIVKHNGDTKTFDGSLDSSNTFRYSVFFADCQHKLLKVTSGTRLCLAFNLVRHRSIRENQEFRLKEIIGRLEKVRAVLKPWLEETMRREPGELAERFAIPLQHEYTIENLCFTGLKGDDSIVAEVLKSCQDNTGEQWLDLHLCLVTKYEEENTDSGELYEDNEVKNWIGLDDERAVAFEKVDIDMDREVAVREGEQPFHDEPNVEEYRGYTGNEGPSLERWYHRAMLVVWPRKRSIPIACGAGIFGALDLIDPMLETNDQQLCDSVHEVVCYCENNASTLWSRSGEDGVTSRLLNLCIRTGGSENIMRVLNLMSKTLHQGSHTSKFGSRHVGLGDCHRAGNSDIPWKVGIRSVSVANGVALAVQKVGWEECSSIVVELVKECTLSQGEAFFQLAMQLFEMGNKDAAIIVAKKPCEVFHARIDELSKLEEPEFSWCQPSARCPRHPIVQDFLRGPQESMIFTDLKSLPNARRFARENFNGFLTNGYSALGTEDGRGAKACCKIRKTRHACEVAMNWEKLQEELKTLRLRLEKFRAIGMRTEIASVNMAPDVAADLGKKRNRDH